MTKQAATIQATNFVAVVGEDVVCEPTTQMNAMDALIANRCGECGSDAAPCCYIATVTYDAGLEMNIISSVER